MVEKDVWAQLPPLSSGLAVTLRVRASSVSHDVIFPERWVISFSTTATMERVMLPFCHFSRRNSCVSSSLANRMMPDMSRSRRWTVKSLLSLPRRRTCSFITVNADGVSSSMVDEWDSTPYFLSTTRMKSSS